MTAGGSARRVLPRADLPGVRRCLGAVAAFGLALGLIAGLGGCANIAALGLARQACHHVSAGLVLYQKAATEPDPARAARDRERSEEQLSAASSLAADAAGQAPEWQALMATLAESGRLPESSLVHALGAQCAVVETGVTVPPLPPATLPTTTLPAPPS